MPEAPTAVAQPTQPSSRQAPTQDIVVHRQLIDAHATATGVRVGGADSPRTHTPGTVVAAGAVRIFDEVVRESTALGPDHVDHAAPPPRPGLIGAESSRPTSFRPRRSTGATPIFVLSHVGQSAQNGSCRPRGTGTALRPAVILRARRHRKSPAARWVPRQGSATAPLGKLKRAAVVPHCGRCSFSPPSSRPTSPPTPPGPLTPSRFTTERAAAPVRLRTRILAGAPRPKPSPGPWAASSPPAPRGCAPASVTSPGLVLRPGPPGQRGSVRPGPIRMLTCAPARTRPSGDLIAYYGRARAAADAAIDDLDLAGGTSWHGVPVSLHWVLVHEETARHAGHLDILRELTDGHTGNPPT